MIAFRPATLLNRDSNTDISLIFPWFREIFKNTYFEEHLWTTASAHTENNLIFM